MPATEELYRGVKVKEPRAFGDSLGLNCRRKMYAPNFKLWEPLIRERLSMMSKLLFRRVKRLAGSPAVLYAPEKLTEG
jgi:hypothetical protein